MKTWLFALVQSAIAALGLIAFFWADNVVLASAAAVMAAVLAIVQPILSARQKHKLDQYTNRQFQKSLRSNNRQVRSLLKEVVDPPLPHRPTVAAGLRAAFPKEAARLLGQYDAVAKALTTGDKNAAKLAEQFSDAVDPWAVGAYLQALIALRAGKIESAHEFFSKAKEAHSAWAAAWLGWAATAYKLGRIDQIREQHPHINRVELLPYGAGDQDTFLELNEQEREEVAGEFQQVATALGNFYTIAEFSNAGKQITAAHDDFKQVA